MHTCSHFPGLPSETQNLSYSSSQAVLSWKCRGRASSPLVPFSSPLPSLIFLTQKLEGRVASDEDLKLSDMLRYYMRDSQAAKVRGGPRYSQGWRPCEEGRQQNPWQQSSCAYDLRTCCTGGFGHWPTMRTLTKRWTKLVQGTGKCDQQRATNSCVASALSASLTLPSRVSPEAWHGPSEDPP